MPEFSTNHSLDKISFHAESIDFDLQQAEAIAFWLATVVNTENKALQSLSFIFCNDEYLHQLNVEYLQHDTLTDVITFPYSRPEEPIHGDIFISIDRVKENAATFEKPFLNELHRVMVHGTLHLAGFGDKTPEEIQVMRSKEDHYLTILKN